MSALRASCRRMSRWACSASIRSRSSTPSLRSRAASGWSCPMRSGTIAAASASRASPLQSSMRSAASPSDTRRPSPPHPRSRASRASSGSSSNSRGAGREAGSPPAHFTAASSWPTGCAPTSPASCSLATSMATCPMSRCPRASRSLPTTALPTSRWQESGRGRKRRACAPISDGACRAASIAWRPGKAGASSPTTCSGHRARRTSPHCPARVSA